MVKYSLGLAFMKRDYILMDEDQSKNPLIFWVKLYYIYIVIQSVCTVHNKFGFLTCSAHIIFLSTICLLSRQLAPYD